MTELCISENQDNQVILYLDISKIFQDAFWHQGSFEDEAHFPQ